MKPFECLMAGLYSSNKDTCWIWRKRDITMSSETEMFCRWLHGHMFH